MFFCHHICFHAFSFVNVVRQLTYQYIWQSPRIPRHVNARESHISPIFLYKKKLSPRMPPPHPLWFNHKTRNTPTYKKVSRIQTVMLLSVRWSPNNFGTPPASSEEDLFFIKGILTASSLVTLIKCSHDFKPLQRSTFVNFTCKPFPKVAAPDFWTDIACPICPIWTRRSDFGNLEIYVAWTW